MKILRFAIFAFLITSAATSQNNFGSGYYITSDSTRVDASIDLNSLRVINDKEVLVVKNGSAKLEVDSKDILEIGIGDDIKLRKYTVFLEKSNLINNIPHDAEPVYTRTSLFLNAHIEGEASLYSYTSKLGTKFFYSVGGDEEMRQLLYKKYKQGNITKEVTEFRRQLSENVRCTEDDHTRFLSLKYTVEDLTPIFERYNTCSETPFQEYQNKQKKSMVLRHFVIAGIGMGNLSMNVDGVGESALEIFSFNAGGEMEFLSPRGNWAVFARLDLGTIHGNISVEQRLSELSVTGFTRTLEAKMVAANLHVGPRFYFNPNSKNVIYADAGVGMSYYVGSINSVSYITSHGVEYNRIVDDSNAKAALSLSGTVGLFVSKNLAVEVRYEPTRTILERYASHDVSYSRIGIGGKYLF